MFQRARTQSLRRFVLTSTALVLVLVQAAPVRGWGRQGHRIVARFAQTRLQPAALAKVRELLEKDEDIADASTWADEYSTRHNAPWHYVNVPLDAPRYDARFCDPDQSCVVVKIKEFVNVLKDPTANDLDKRRALRFVIHLVADLHQPFHVADNRDRGGNLLQVRYFDQGTNMHAVWDYQILRFDPQNAESGRGRKVDERMWVNRLTGFTTPARLAQWSENKAIEDWANESLQLAKRAYKNPGTGTMIQSGQSLGDNYERWAIAKVEERLAQAGVRLADILNDVFHDPGRGP